MTNPLLRGQGLIFDIVTGLLRPTILTDVLLVTVAAATASVTAGSAATASYASNAGTSGGLSAGSAGDIPYQAGASSTAFLGIGASGTVLTSNGSAPTWANSVSVANVTASSTTSQASLIVIGSASNIPTVSSLVGGSIQTEYRQTASSDNTIKFSNVPGSRTSTITQKSTGDFDIQSDGNIDLITTGSIKLLTGSSPTYPDLKNASILQTTSDGSISKFTPTNNSVVTYDSAGALVCTTTANTDWVICSTPAGPTFKNPATTLSVLRTTNLAGGSAGSMNYQTGSGTTGTISPGTSGYLLQSNGTAAPTFIDPASIAIGTAVSATTATNLASGTVGSIPYQSAAGTTAMLAAGTSGFILKSNGAAPPSYVNPNTLAAGSSDTATNLAGGSAGTLPYQSASGTTAMLSAGSANRLLQSNGAAPPTWESDLKPGRLNVNGTPPFNCITSITGETGSGNPPLAIFRTSTDAGDNSIVLQKDTSAGFKNNLILFRAINNPGTVESFAGVNTDDDFVLDGRNRQVKVLSDNAVVIESTAGSVTLNSPSVKLPDADLINAPFFSTDGAGKLIRATLSPYNLLSVNASGQISQISPGTSGQLFTSNGPSALPSFQGLSTTKPKITTYGETSSGTHNFTAGCKWYELWITGGGASGGHSFNGFTNGVQTSAYSGSGGGAGGTVYHVSDTVPSSFNFVVGYGGDAQTSENATGYPGYFSQIASLGIIAYGGDGGKPSSSDPNGGGGGDATGGTLRYRGGDGESGRIRYNLLQYNVAIDPTVSQGYALGGASFWSTARGTSTPYNGGGGGAGNQESRAGADGILVIKEYFN